jgi:hypothetical protein
MIFSGSLDNVNAALDSLTFTPTPNTPGPASIQIATNDGKTGTDSDTLSFTIQGAPRVVSIMRASPAGEDTNADAVSYTVTFSEAVTGVDATDFKLTAPEAVAAEAITSVTPIPSDLSTVWTVTVKTGTGDGTLRLDLADDNTIVNASGVALVGDATFDGSFTTGQSYTIDKTGPTTTIDSIDISDDTGPDGDFVTATAAQTITAELSAPLGGAILQGSVNGGTTWTPIPAGMVSGTTITWTGVTLLPGSSQAIQFRVVDALGNAGAVATQAYTLDTTAPVLSSTTPTAPLDDATGVAVGADLVLTFGEAIAKGTGFIELFSANGTLIEAFDAAISDRLSFSGDTLTIDPTANLSYATGYYVTVASTAVVDLAGNAFAGIAGTGAFNFTTAAAPPPPPLLRLLRAARRLDLICWF